jgi:hypothetical protein
MTILNELIVLGVPDCWERQYQHDSTASRLLSEVSKHVRAWLVHYYGGGPRWNPRYCSLFAVFAPLGKRIIGAITDAQSLDLITT